MKQIVRIYQRVSTEDQSLERQNHLITEAEKNGFYVAAVYSEKASGATPNRPELNRLLNDLQEGDIIVAENIDRLSRLPAVEANNLVQKIREKKARISVPNFNDLTDYRSSGTMTDLVINELNELLLKFLLYMAHENYNTLRQRQREGIERAKARKQYKGRKPDLKKHKLILELRSHGKSLNEIAALAQCGTTLVKDVIRKEKQRIIDENNKSQQIDISPP